MILLYSLVGATTSFIFAAPISLDLRKMVLAVTTIKSKAVRNEYEGISNNKSNEQVTGLVQSDLCLGRKTICETFFGNFSNNLNGPIHQFLKEEYQTRNVGGKKDLVKLVCSKQCSSMAYTCFGLQLHVHARNRRS